MNSFYIESYACQMNTADGETAAGILSGVGLRQVSVPEEADLILVNTCTVRESAVSRVLARISRFKPLKKSRPGLKIAVTGCLAEQEKEALFTRLPFIDYVIGPDQYRALAGLTAEKAVHAGPAALPGEGCADPAPLRKKGINAWIPVMRGCDNFCSYCIVPHVRGPERSRSADRVIAEVEEAVREGFPQVTFLGQNVNSYRGGGLDFPSLLRRTDRVPGLRRVRFMTSHPKDLSGDLIRCFGELETLCEHLHLPVQSGSDAVLDRMNRGYTAKGYLEKIFALRKQCPGIALTTDVLSGFPGETGADHEATLALIREAEFDAAFMFIYSERKGTKAAAFGDSVVREEKVRRISEIIALQKEITGRKNRACVGRTEEVLVEGESPRDPSRVTSRTRTFKNVIFKGTERSRGAFIRVVITGAAGFALLGETAGGEA